jgi:uncharacterized protein YcgI (DUF1989 family)
MLDGVCQNPTKGRSYGRVSTLDALAKSKSTKEDQSMEVLTVPPAGGIGCRLNQGDQLRVVNTHGGQTGDLMAYTSDGLDRLSNGRTFDYNGKIYLSTGDVLWSEGSVKMLSILADDTGRHDFLYAPCSIEMYRIEYGVTDYHPNCRDNLRQAFKSMGLNDVAIPAAFNIFMVADVAANGSLAIRTPNCPPGSSLLLRAEADIIVAVSTCPASTCNAGAAIQPLSLEILRGA